MKKKLMAILLGTLLIFSLFAGCAKNDGTNTSSAPSGSAPSGSAPASSAASASKAAAPSADVVAKRIDDAKKTGKYQKVVMTFMNFSGSPKGLQDVEAGINKITEQKLGLDVQLIINDAASYRQQTPLLLSSGEQVDIFNALATGYSSAVNSGYCLDLEKNNLIAQYGQGIVKEVGQTYIDASRFGGVLYGLPQQKNQANGLDCYVIGAQYLDGIGYDYKSQLKNPGDEIIHTDINTINDIFAKLHSKYPDKAVTVPTNLAYQKLDVDNVGNDLFGVLLNLGQDMQVKDLFTSDSYMNLCQRYYQWNKAGYISKDAMTNNVAATQQVKAGTAMSYSTAGKPGISSQESGLCGQNMIVFQLGKDFLTSVASMPWCINSNTKDPVAAMQFLNLAYTDPDISNLLCWGVEGKDYKKTSDGHITFADGVTPANAQYFNNVNWELPNQFIAYIWVGNDLSVWDRTRKFNTDAVSSKALGFIFDNSSVSTEYTALTNVYNQYQNQLEYGFTDPKVGIPEMEGKLKAAGLDKYMQAKQAQLDTWAKAKK